MHITIPSTFDDAYKALLYLWERPECFGETQTKRSILDIEITGYYVFVCWHYFGRLHSVLVYSLPLVSITSFKGLYDEMGWRYFRLNINMPYI